MISVCLISTNMFESEHDNTVLDRCLYKIAEKDTAALEELYRLTSASVYSFALSILKNRHDAEDVLHDCYVSIYSSAGQYQSKKKPMAWIITIAKNLCLHKIRERGKSADISQEDWEPFIQSHEGLSNDDKLILYQFMGSLSDTERQIVILHAVSGFKHREIAKLLQIPLPTVLSKYNRALTKLKKLYEGE